MPRLKVSEVDASDVFGDRVRLNHRHRKGVAPGKIIVITVADRSLPLAARGSPKADVISFDEASRRALGIERGHEYDFTIRRAYWWEAVKWSLGASDPTQRIASRMGFVGLILGIAGFIISALPAFEPAAEWFGQITRDIITPGA